VAVLRGIVRWARICPSTLIDSPSRIRQVTSPGPWTFYQYRYGFSHVVCDADGRIIASSVMAKDGPVSADATPRVGIASRLGNAPEIAKSAVEACEERARSGQLSSSRTGTHLAGRHGPLIVGIAS